MTSSVVSITTAFIAGFLFSQPAFGQSISPDETLFELGPEEIVFDWTTDRCQTEDIPDSPARAFRDANGKTHLIATHFINREMIGDSLAEVAHNCDVILASHYDSDPAKYDDKEWIWSVYTTDGTNIHALLHNEYQGSSHSGMCTTDYLSCWYNAITYASSGDMGKTYTHATAPGHRVANVPYIYVADTGPYGIFEGSNIIRNPNDNYYYRLVHMEPYDEQQIGTGVMRTLTLSDPSSWRCWDGQGFNVTFIDPYMEENFDPADHLCAPVSFDNIVGMSHSVTYNSYFNTFVLVGATGKWNESGQLIHGFYYSFSDDLINWAPRKLLMQTKLWWTPEIPGDSRGYPTLIDPSDNSWNFEVTDDQVYLYYTVWHTYTLYDRDLVRRPVTFHYLDRDDDGVNYPNDNCPENGNPEQENLDGDEFGDVCDDDVDGDGQNNTVDDDDDNDGLPDTGDPSEASTGSNPHDPDSDGDGVGDRFDRSPLTPSNICTLDNQPIYGVVYAGQDLTCAAKESILVQDPTEVRSTGVLELISPKIEMEQIKIDDQGELIIKSGNPCLNC